MTDQNGDDVVVSAEIETAPQSSVKSLEERYIVLLEDKIKRLEAELQAKVTKSEDTGDLKKTSKPTSEPELSVNTKETRRKPVLEPSSKIKYIYRKRLVFGEYEDREVSEWESAKPEDEAKDDSGDTVIAWRRVKDESRPEAGKQELLIQSKLLRATLKPILLDTSAGTNWDTDEVSFDAPYAIFYHNHKRLLEFLQDPKSSEKARAEVQLLKNELDKEHASVRRDTTAYQNGNTITYELLWTLFWPGTHVIMDVLGEPHRYVVQMVDATGSTHSTSETFWLLLWYIDWDGSEYRIARRDFTVKKFAGAKSMAELGICPLELWRDPQANNRSLEDLDQDLRKRGRQFELFCTGSLEKRHRKYTGLALRAGSVDMAVENGIGDSASISVKNADPTDKPAEQMHLDSHSMVMIDHHSYLHFEHKPLMVGEEDIAWVDCVCKRCDACKTAFIGSLPKSVNGKFKGLSDGQLLLCPPRVLGFAVAEKKFAQLLIKNIEPEMSKDDRERAFRNLEMQKSQKETLKKLVCEHAKGDYIEDLIPNKGKGLVILLHGSPGAGKTLTAESLAMLTGKPLYSVSMSDVGVSPLVVEYNLRHIFQLATHWKALLLFDEADVFLEARSLQDLRRNSLVSTLLRILEYFQGILFLTSNRTKTFDEAFQSRIHFAIQYGPLNPTQRRAIWKMWFDKAKARDELSPGFNVESYLGDDDDDGTLVSADLNGREIRNVFRSAMTLAKASDPRQLEWKNLEDILKRTVKFKTYMLQGEESAKKENIR